MKRIRRYWYVIMENTGRIFVFKFRFAFPLLTLAWCTAASIALAQTPSVSVSVSDVVRGPVRAWLNTEGTARAVRREILHFRQTGRVVEVGVDEAGALLREGSVVLGPQDEIPGQLIGRLDDRNYTEKASAQKSQANAAQQRVASASSSVNQQRAALKRAQQDLKRVTDLVKKGWAARKKLDEATSKQAQSRAQLQSALAELAAVRAEAQAARSETAQERLRGEELVIRAPFDGVIGFMNMAEGDYLSPLPVGETDISRLLRMAAVVVIDPNAYEVTVEVPSFLSLSIQRGMDAQIAWGGMNLFDIADDPAKAGLALPIAKAEVYAVAPAIAPDSRSVRIRLRTLEGAEHLRDGLYVAVRIMAARREDAVLSRIEALRYDKGQGYVFVVDPATKTASRRNVRTGMTEGHTIEIRDGLEPGEMVVTKGQDQLQDKTPVVVVDGSPTQ